jgi:hypothetical protein
VASERGACAIITEGVTRISVTSLIFVEAILDFDLDGDDAALSL